MSEEERTARTSFESWSARGGEFLLTNLDAALTVMDVAEATESKERAQHNYHNARAIYDTVLRLLPKLQLGVAQQNEIHKKLAAVKVRLMGEEPTLKAQLGEQPPLVPLVESSTAIIEIPIGGFGCSARVHGGRGRLEN